MNNQEQFRTGVIKPVECFSEGWDLIKDRYWLFLGITFVGFFLGGLVPFFIIMGAMLCGIYYALGEQYEGREPQFGDLFKGFEVFLPSLVATVIWAIPLTIGFIIAYIPLIFLQFSIEGNNPPAPEIIFSTLTFVFVVFGVLMILWIFIHPFLMLVYQLVMDKKMSGIQALKLSFKGVWGNLGGMVGLLVLNMLAYTAGALLCGIGAYFVLPLIFADTYIAYRKIFPAPASRNFDPPPPNAYQNL